MMENKDLSKEQNKQNSKTDNIHESVVTMNNLLRSELLGQQVIDIAEANRIEGQIKSPPRKELASSNLFKYRNSPMGSSSMDGSSGGGVGGSGGGAGSNGLGGLTSSSPLHSASSGDYLTGGSKLLSFSSSQAGSGRAAPLSPKKPSRKISKTPFKVLDAPALQDDYYLNLVDWSHSNVISVALGSSVYLWSACTSKVTRLCDLGPDDSVTSIAWATSGNHISVGSNSGRISIWDSTTCRVVRELQGHESRVGTMAWSSSLLASGSRDRNIYMQDIRIRGGGNSSSASAYNLAMSRSGDGYAVDDYTQSLVSEIGLSRTQPYSADHAPPSPPPSTTRLHRAASSPTAAASTINTPLASPVLSPTSAPAAALLNMSVVRLLSGHKQEVCGLKWSFDDKLLASGGNDNKLFVWEAGQSRGNNDPVCRFEDHSAAVKAVAWSPHQNGLLASGGGTADRHIRFWNALTNVSLHKIDTGSQVCNLMWSKNVNEIVSTHGYSLNQVIVWKYPSMQKIATLTGHSLRVLYLAMSPDGQSVVTGAGDETLRFWNIFPGPRSRTGFRIGPSLLSPSGTDIR